MVAPQLSRCRSAVIAGTEPGGLFSADESDGRVVDDSVIRAVADMLAVAGTRSYDLVEDPEPHLRRLVALTAMERSVDDWMREAVRSLRKDGVSWAQIAEATGMKSRQAAQKRWNQLGE